jgi:hypothetical protein
MEGREVDEDISNVRSVENLCESDELMLLPYDVDMK